MQNKNKFKGKYRVESTRLRDYDYSRNGAYFATICTKNNKHLLGSVVNQNLISTQAGEIVTGCWLKLPAHYSNCILDEFIVMPDHIHSIIIVDNEHCNNVETGLKPVSTETSKPHTLSEIVRGFKTFSARKINLHRHTTGKPFWQPRFYEHIIRTEAKLNRIRKYIIENPLKWESDKNNPENLFM